MKQSISIVTLGVDDYARAKSFYEALGWTVTLDIQETAFFQANGVVLVLWSREKLAEDTDIDERRFAVGWDHARAQRGLPGRGP